MNRRIRKAILRGDAARAEYYEASHRIRSGEHPLRAVWLTYARRMALEVDRLFTQPPSPPALAIAARVQVARANTAPGERF